MGTNSYRRDIDGLRAIAVMAVILFHFGYLPNGYLGVDVFFVISGYLITKIVFKEANENRFSIIRFYLRRIRRIIPLVLFTTSIALIAGLFVMLPDDLENLSQSVVATNFFANNILLLITTRDYWDIVNEYKPLMHTWSLGIEEQFYLFYPLIFLILSGKRIRLILPFLLLLTAISVAMFILTSDEAPKFYSIQFRFFELSFGGLGAVIFKDKLIKNRFKVIFISVILFILFVSLNVPKYFNLLAIVIAALGILVSQDNYKKSDTFILENNLMVGIGKISFSLYMWHQILLAFTRYFVLDKLSISNSLIIFIIILFISILSFQFIEQPFRDKNRIKTKTVLLTTGILFILSTGISLFIYSKAGIIKDVPELDIVKADVQKNLNIINVKGNPHIRYNARIYDLNKDFTTGNKIRVLIIGNSFARDWANILLESKYGNGIEISYVYDINNCMNINERLSKAKYIFFSDMDGAQFETVAHTFKIDTSKIWNVGTKNFGTNNGIFYSNRGKPGYCTQRTFMEKGYWERNDILNKQWGGKYVDLIGMVIDKTGKMPVFTPECKFISEDCRHLSHNGAVYFGRLLNINQHLRFD